MPRLNSYRELEHLRQRLREQRQSITTTVMVCGGPGCHASHSQAVIDAVRDELSSQGLGDSVYEMKIDAGPGYRVYYMRDGLTVYLLLTGGDKDSQDSDVKLAKKLALELKQERGK